MACVDSWFYLSFHFLVKIIHPLYRLTHAIWKRCNLTLSVTRGWGAEPNTDVRVCLWKIKTGACRKRPSGLSFCFGCESKGGGRRRREKAIVEERGFVRGRERCRFSVILSVAARWEGGEWGQNAGEAGFSEPKPRRPGEGRSVCLNVTCVFERSVCVCVLNC